MAFSKIVKESYRKCNWFWHWCSEENLIGSGSWSWQKMCIRDRFLLEDNCSIVVRPSGTEPKLKTYISVSAENKEAAEKVEAEIDVYKRQEQGAKRVVTARELSLAEIKEIREHIPEEMEIEKIGRAHVWTPVTL